jgi:hypothetical protein
VQDDIRLNDLLKTVPADYKPVARRMERGEVIEAVAVGLSGYFDVGVLLDCFQDCFGNDSALGVSDSAGELAVSL